MTVRMQTLLILVLFAFGLVGCAGPLDTAKRTVTPIVTVFNTMAPELAAAEKDELAACLVLPVTPEQSPACVEAVAQRWVGVKAILLSVRSSLRAAELVIAVADAHATRGEPVDEAALVQAATAVLDAANRLQALALLERR